MPANANRMEASATARTDASRSSTGLHGHFDATIMLAMHDAFRRDLAHLGRVTNVRAADLADADRRAAVMAGWEVFKTQLHHHHTAEDADLWPRMRNHLADRPDDLALLDAMEQEHQRIIPLLAAVDSAFADRDHGHERLGDAVDALATELPSHLAHEEREALPLANRALTAKDWRAFTADQRRKNGIRGAAQMYPWMLDSTSAGEVHAVLHTLPPPLRIVYRRVWWPRYARINHWTTA